MENIENSKKNKFIKNNYWVNKFKYAFTGLITSIKEEKSMIVHLLIAIVVIIFSLAIKISITSWPIIVVTIGFVITIELLNTSIENLIDMVSFKYNINAKKVKDISAAATLIVALMSVAIALLIFIPRIIEIVNYGY